VNSHGGAVLKHVAVVWVYVHLRSRNGHNTSIEKRDGVDTMAQSFRRSVCVLGSAEDGHARFVVSNVQMPPCWCCESQLVIW